MVALIDSGCDVTVIPQAIAEAIGLDLGGRRSQLYAFREHTDVAQSVADVTLLAKQDRLAATIHRVPVLIALQHPDEPDETEIVLGVAKVFDQFDISFQKSRNRIEFKNAKTT